MSVFRILVLPRRIIQELTSPDNKTWYLISVASTESDRIEKNELIDSHSVKCGDIDVWIPNEGSKFAKANLKSFISLVFDDVDRPTEKYKLFSEEQARTIITYLTFMDVTSTFDTLVVQCDAGISRSAGIGSFINDIEGLSWDRFKQDNPHIYPNAHVYRTLRKVLDEMEQKKEKL